MNINALLGNIRTTLRQDATLIAWIAAQYGGSVKIYRWMDNRHPPGGVDLPAIVLYPMGKTGGIRDEEKTYTVQILMQIENDGKTITTDGYGTYVDYDGGIEIGDFTEIVADAVYTNRATIFTGVPPYVSFEMNPDLPEEFPKFVANLIATFSEVKDTNSEPYA